MEYVKDNLNKFSAVEIAGAAGILNSLNLLANTAGEGKAGFAESLGVLFDIHVAAARLGLINKNLDADPNGMFRTEGDIREIAKDQVFLGGVHGRNTHSMAEWIKLDREGRLDDEDRTVILKQYADHLTSNFAVIGREVLRHRTIARQEMNEFRDKSRLARLFTRRQYPVCVFPEGFNPKTATKESYRKMAAKSFAAKVGSKVPTLTIPESILDERMPFLAENPFIKVAGSVTKSLANDLAIEIQLGGDRFDHKDLRDWLHGISKDDLQAFRTMVEAYATQLHPEGETPRNKEWVRGQLDGWLAGVVTKEDQIAQNEKIEGLEKEFETIQKAYAIAEKTDCLVSGELAKDFIGPVVWSKELPLMIPERPDILGVAFMDYKDCTNVHVLTDDGECRLVEAQSRDTILAVAKACETLLEERLGNKVPSHDFIEQLENGPKEGHSAPMRTADEIMDYFRGMPLDDLVLAFKFYEPGQDAPGYIVNNKDRESVQKTLRTYLDIPVDVPEVDEEVIRKSSKEMFLNTLRELSPDTLKQMANELRASGLGEQADERVISEQKDSEAAKERLREDIDYECRIVLRSLTDNDAVKYMKSPVFAPPQDLDGNLFHSFNAARLSAEMAAKAAKIPVFLSEKDVAAMGLAFLPNERNRFCTLEDGSRVWNIAQTTYRRQHPEHFRAIESACQAPSMDDDTYVKMRRFWATKLDLADKADITEHDRQKKMQAFFRENYGQELSGNIDEARNKRMMSTSIASLAMVAKMRYDPCKEDGSKQDMHFADVDTVYSFRKGATMYPSYETMMDAGRQVAAMEKDYPIFYERQGVDIVAVIKHVNTNIRIRNERHQAEAEAHSNGIHR